MFYYLMILLILGNPLQTSPVSSIINLLSIFSGFSRHPNPCVPASDETGSEFGGADKQAGRQAGGFEQRTRSKGTLVGARVDLRV